MGGRGECHNACKWSALVTFSIRNRIYIGTIYFQTQPHKTFNKPYLWFKNPDHLYEVPLRKLFFRKNWVSPWRIGYRQTLYVMAPRSIPGGSFGVSDHIISRRRHNVPREHQLDTHRNNNDSVCCTRSAHVTVSVAIIRSAAAAGIPAKVTSYDSEYQVPLSPEAPVGTHRLPGC